MNCLVTLLTPLQGVGRNKTEDEARAVEVENIYRGAMNEELRAPPVARTISKRSFLCVFGILC
jgi:hypothetical protein